jgi:hypothetical protein
VDVLDVVAGGVEVGAADVGGPDVVVAEAGAFAVVGDVLTDEPPPEQAATKTSVVAAMVSLIVCTD